MKRESTSESAASFRHVLACSLLTAVSMIGLGVFSNGLAQTKNANSEPDRSHSRSTSADAAPPGRVVHSSHTKSFSKINTPQDPSPCDPAAWSTSTTGPGPHYRSGSATDGTYVFVFGGGDAFGNNLNELWRWDPATQTWTQLANMPTGKRNIQGAYWNGKIYVPGGYTGVHITENAIYDIATNTWTTGAPLPVEQTGQNVAFNNKIYNFGGNPGPQTTTSIYDIATNTWSTGAPMPVAILYGRATVAGPYAYYVGGILDGTTTTNTVYRYDFAADSWATMAPLQTARTSEELMTSADGSKLFAVMGGDSTFFTGVPQSQSVEIYDIAGNNWRYGNPVVIKAAAPAGGLVGNQLMVQGGTDDDNYYDTVQVSVVPAPPCPTPTPTPTPIENYVFTTSTGASIVPGSTDIGNHCFGCSTPITLPFPFQFYDQVFTTASVSSDGLIQFVQTGSGCCGGCLPNDFLSYVIAADWSDLFTEDTANGQGIFTSVSGTAPNRIFNIEWRAGFCCGGLPTENFEVRLYETSNRIDIIYGAVSPSGSANFGIGLQRETCQFTTVSCGVAPASGTQYTFTTGPAPQPLLQYLVSSSSGVPIVPGTSDIGNHCDDCTTPLNFPFPVRFYDQVFTHANIGSNGNIQFTGANSSTGGCLPDSSVADTIAAHWTDLYTADTGSGQGIFTSVTGTAPNRIFNIEWRANYCCGGGPPTQNFEVQLFENQNRINIIYGTPGDGGVGVQRGTGDTCQYTAVSCFANPPAGTQYTFTPSFPTAIRAVSRKTHAGVVDFDVDLPLTGTPGIESRIGGTTNDYTIVVTFSDDVAVNGNPQAQVTSGTATIGSGGLSNGGVVTTKGQTVIIPLTLVADQQTLQVTLNGVANAGMDVPGVNLSIPMSRLLGDTNVDRAVNASDLSQTKARIGRTLSVTNFRSDVNFSGRINSADVAIIKGNIGHGLP